MKDEIIEQVWTAKDQLMRECGHDLDKLAVLLRQRQQERKHDTVDLTNPKAAGSRSKP
jgi:hypothetical protein